MAGDALWVVSVVAGTPGIEAEGSVAGLVAALAGPVALALLVVALPPAVAWPLSLAVGAEEPAEAEPAGMPGMAALAALALDEAEPGADEREVAVAAGEPVSAEEAAEVVEADVTPGMAAMASATWVSSWDVAGVAAVFDCLLTPEAEDFAVVPPADFVAAALVLVAAVVDAGRLPLSTKPCTPSELSEPEYSCALTEKLGSESPPIVDSTPEE